VSEIDEIEGYHAHVYWTSQEERDRAALLREELGERFDVKLGRWHDKLVGPHPRSSYQVAFPEAEFQKVVPWLMLNRRGLTVLVHPLTGDAYADHSAFPVWLGESLDLDLSVLPRKYTENQAAEIRGKD